MDLAELDLLFAGAFQLLGVGLGDVAVRPLGLGLLQIVLGVGGAGVSGDGIDVLLDALGFVEAPLVGGLVLIEHRPVGRDDGGGAFEGLKAGGQRRQHGQDGDGDRDQRDERVVGVRRVLGVFQV